MNHTISITNNFSYLKTNQKNQRYSSEYRFDVIKKGQHRVTWIHISDDLPVYS